MFVAERILIIADISVTCILFLMPLWCWPTVHDAGLILGPVFAWAGEGGECNRPGLDKFGQEVVAHWATKSNAPTHSIYLSQHLAGTTFCRRLSVSIPEYVSQPLSLQRISEKST